MLLPREHGEQGLLDDIVVARPSSLCSLVGVVGGDHRSRLAGVVEGARFGAPRPLRWVSSRLVAPQGNQELREGKT